jgi:hypothetical protein
MANHCYDCDRLTKSRTDGKSDYCAVCGVKKWRYD